MTVWGGSLRSVLAATAASAALLAGPHAQAETIMGALSRAYASNPSLNAQRANVRATDENVPQAKSLSRPRLTGTADAGVQYVGTGPGSSIGSTGSSATTTTASSSTSTGTGTDVTGTSVTSPTTGTTSTGSGGTTVTTRAGESTYVPRGVGFTIDQNLYNGNRTENAVYSAESLIYNARETLRNSEQTVLLNAATAYMNVLRDTAILSLRRNNVEVLEEQLRQTRDRFTVGEVTRTDVAQAESSLATSRSDQSAAESNLKTSIATYRQVIGDEPRRLDPAQSVEPRLPATLAASLKVSEAENPQITAALHLVDYQQYQVRVAQADLLPTVGVRGSISKRYDSSGPGTDTTAASVIGSLSVPIYEGGQYYSRVRQAKETLGQRRIEVDTARDTVRQAVVSTWGALETARAQIVSGQAAVRAAEIALAGVREEAKVGQRTTLDVLNAQQVLLNNRVLLVTAQRDRVVASYNVFAAIGRLSARSLSLAVANYDSRIHYQQVKDKWFGMRTPDGQ